MTFTHGLSTNNYGCAKFIVSATASQGTHLTLESALAVASSGDTIFLRPGTYTLSGGTAALVAGVNIAAYDCDALTPNVTVIGKLTFASAGSVSISGIRLQTPTSPGNDFFLAVTGSAASIVNIKNCYLNCANNTGISFTSSSSSAQINIIDSKADTGNTGIAYFSDSSAGTLSIIQSEFLNTGGSSEPCTKSAGQLSIKYCSFRLPITYSSSNSASTYTFSNASLGSVNATFLTTSGTGTFTCSNCNISTGSASAISVGVNTTVSVNNATINSTNTNIITGLGSIQYTGLSLTGSSSNINTTSQNNQQSGPSANFGASNSGGTNTLTVFNSSNTASSAANIVANVAGGTAADPTFQATITSGQAWTWGLDNSDSDAFVLAASSSLGSSNVMRASTAGEINKPLQPAFLAYLNTTVTDVTGDGTVYTIIYDTEVYDQNSDFNLATSTFTAPVTGRYQFNFVSRLQGGSLNSMTAAVARMVFSNLTYRASMFNFISGTPYAGAVCTISILIDMDSADTLTVTVNATDTGGKITDVSGASSGEPQNYLSGFLAC